ncbi:MAG: carboxypeptidase-like regulatory domain-containing protein [bacterium]|nr:carboxypeptidase-like regulatory domain-containing protein [bacterium]
METGRGRYIFPPDELAAIVESNLNGAYFALNLMAGPGITGHIRDAETGEPLEAEVWLPDIDSEDVKRRNSDPRFGRFYRLLEPGSYRIIVMKQGYRPKIFKDVEVTAKGWQQLEVHLEKFSAEDSF